MTEHTQRKIVMYFIAVVLAGWSADAAEVSLRPQAHARGSLVLLSDVATVTGADAALTKRLERVELFPAPARQRSKLLHVRELAELLILHGIDLANISFTGTRTTRIYAERSPTRTMKPETFPTGDGETAPNQDMVVVATRTLNRGDLIRDVDVELRPADALTRRYQTLSDLRQVVGMELTTAIREGFALSPTQLRKPLLIKRGQLVRVRARAAGVSVTTTARSTEDGAIGDIILVQSPDNREKYAAYVTGLQQAEVYASGIVAADPTPRTSRRVEQLPEIR